MKTNLLSQLKELFQLAKLASEQPEKSLDDVLSEYHSYQESRRNFLKTAAKTSLVLGAGGSFLTDDLILDGLRKKYRVAIVGAGMAGLSAGYFLRRKGVKATIFEGDKRVGGRIKSVHHYGGGTLHTEIGAEFIDTLHQEMLWFVKVLKLEEKILDVEMDSFGHRDAFFIENKHYTVKDIVAELKGVYPKILADQSILEGKNAPDLDQVSMAEYLESLPVSEWVKKLLSASFIGENGLETSEQSATNLLSVLEIRNEKYYPFGSSDERFKVLGGNEQIPQGIAALLTEQIRYEHRLQAIRENKNKSLTLVFSENGSPREETFDLVIMALPFSILRNIDIQMDLPVAKKKIIQEMGYGTNAKFILETQTRAWRNAGYRGFLFNDVIHNGWDSSQMQGNNEGYGTYTCYFGGERGRNAAKGSENALLKDSLPILNAAFAGMESQFTGKMETAHWSANPFIKGSYSCPRPGQTPMFEGGAFEPVRRLYFAGEHCSTSFWGFMNGAAETGRQAAELVLKKMRV
jgi:monoamine oxidase